MLIIGLEPIRFLGRFWVYCVCQFHHTSIYKQTTLDSARLTSVHLKVVGYKCLASDTTPSNAERVYFFQIRLLRRAQRRTHLISTEKLRNFENTRILRYLLLRSVIMAVAEELPHATFNATPNARLKTVVIRPSSVATGWRVGSNQMVFTEEWMEHSCITLSLW